MLLEMRRYSQYVAKLTNFYFANGQSQLEMWDLYNPIDWTIPLEFRCSLFVFLLVIAVSRIKRLLYRILLIASLALFSFYTGFWSGFCFFFGVLMADIDIWRLAHEVPIDHSNDRQAKLAKSASVLKIILWSAIFIFGLFLASAPPPVPFDEAALGYAYLYELIPTDLFQFGIIDDQHRFYSTWSAAILFAAIRELSLVREFLCCCFVQYLGKVSYSLYLVHYNLATMLGATPLYFAEPLSKWLYGTDNNDKLTPLGQYLGMCILGQMLQIPILFWASDVFERNVDRPCIAFARWFEARTTS